MKIVCDACGAKYSIADEKVAGKVFKIRCKKCSNIIVVRGVKEEAAAGPAFGHDEKETRVFDYSGYDDPQSAVAANEADGAIWHLVIDQEQVGPMTSDEVRARFAAGEIEAHSFVWREGFDDWERLDALAEFSDLGGASMVASGDEAGAAMFGGPALDDPLADAGDPADLFTAQASGERPPVDDGGLFGDAGGDGGLFGASEPMAAAPEPVDERLTGQRNENSVLFSLNNLASLASDSPKPSASPSSSSSGPSMGAGQTTANQDGSGLIDIRAMASMYMGDSPGGAAAVSSGGGIDDLPVFSQPSIAAASPVLMPVAAPSGGNKVMVALIAGIGALVLVAVILLILVLRGGDDEEVAAAKPSGDEVASTATTGDGDEGDEGDGDKGDEGGKVVDGDEAAKSDGDTDAKDATKSETSDEKEGSGRTVTRDKPKKPERKESARERRERLKKERAERERREKERREAREEKPAKTSKGSCDEITCLVDSSKPCCRKSGGSKSSGGSADSDLPDRPTKSQVRTGMNRVSGAVNRCGKRNGFSGKVRVRIRISGSGRISSAKATGGSGAVNRCVSSAIKRARFPKSKNGFSFSYGYNL